MIPSNKKAKMNYVDHWLEILRKIISQVNVINITIKLHFLTNMHISVLNLEVVLSSVQ